MSDFTTTCDRKCEHGLHCVGHTIPEKRRGTVEVQTHVGMRDGDQHRFWRGSVGWQCVLVSGDQRFEMDPVRLHNGVIVGAARSAASVGYGTPR